MRIQSRALALALTCMTVAAVGACAGPTTTRTGAVHHIKIAEKPEREPGDLIVNPGDEVRWIDSRTLPVRADLVNVKSEDVFCERAFSNLFSVMGESATIKPNETVSACFTKPGMVNYNVRMDSPLPGGQVIVPGVIRIGTKR